MKLLTPVRASLKLAFFLSLCLAATGSIAQTFQEGKDYTRLSNPVPVPGRGSKIVVSEAFSYACPGCYAFESVLNAWKQRQQDDVLLEKLHVQFNSGTENLSRAAHAAKALGVEEKIHNALYRSIHVERKPLNTQKQIAAVFEKEGIDEATFNKAFKSFGVNSQLKQDEAKMKGYQIMQTPQLAVDGRYVVSPADHQKMMQVVDFLVKKVREEKGE